MLWKEILTGFVLAGVVAQLGHGVFDALFVRHAPQPLQALENVVVGPVIAVLSFVCSVGNVPLGAVLWSAGISFAGVLAFLFADLIVLPILAIYRKYYGPSFALRITGLMFVTMAAAALLVDGLFTLLGMAPGAHRPTRAQVFSHVGVDYKLVLNVVAFGVFAGLVGLTVRRGATDPMCGMRVDRAKAISRRVRGRTVYFCSEHCAHSYERANAATAASRPAAASSQYP
jgi:YHS domain-containing protein